MAVNPERKEGLPKLREILRRQRDDIDLAVWYTIKYNCIIYLQLGFEKLWHAIV